MTPAKNGSAAAAIGLMRYNARRCEAAKHPTCHCHCGGALHGKVHAESWIREQVERIRTEYGAPPPINDRELATPDLFPETRPP